MNVRRNNRLFALGVAVVAIVAVAIGALVLAGAHTGGSDSASPPLTVITVDPLARGRAVPFGFVGLSLEYPAVEAYAGTDPLAPDPVFEQLVRNLAPGQAPVLRIGGDSADRTWWPAVGLARPGGVTFAITNRWIEVTRALARGLDARLILGLNLEADSPALAGAEARALIDGIGPGAIRALELGNEPDLYPTFTWYRTPDGRRVPGRPPSYDMSALIGDFTRFAAALPQLPLAGPSLGAPPWTRELGRFLAAEPRAALVTLHRYPLQLCFTPRSSPRYPTIGHLLSASASAGLAESFAPYAAVARARGLSLRIDELNSVSCGADAPVSKTFASALWAVDTLFEMVRVGVHGVNLHTFPGAGYELFGISRANSHWRAAVSPEYYGLLMFARAAPAGSRLLRVNPGSSGTVKAWSTRAADGTIRVILINKGTRARLLAVRVPGRGESAILTRLTAPGLRSGAGVTLAGQSFGSRTLTGLLAGRPRISSVAPVAGRYVVQLPGASAAMLVLAPRAPGPR